MWCVYLLLHQVEVKLIRRLALAILSWMQCLQGVSSDSIVDTTMDTTPTSAQTQVKLGGTPELEVGGREGWGDGGVGGWEGWGGE